MHTCNYDLLQGPANHAQIDRQEVKEKVGKVAPAYKCSTGCTVRWINWGGGGGGGVRMAKLGSLAGETYDLTMLRCFFGTHHVSWVCPGRAIDKVHAPKRKLLDSLECLRL